MSLAQIARFHRKLEKIQRRGNTKNEKSIRFAFQNLLSFYCEKKNLSLIPELRYGNIEPDGTVRDNFLNDYGYWESKDTKDDLELEIKKKIAKGYPTNNIIFEDSVSVVLYQNGQKVATAKTANEKALDKILKRFLSFELPEIKEFRTAIDIFKENLPELATALRKIIKEQATNKNESFLIAHQHLLDICQGSINPKITKLEVNEMLVQHILTEDMFRFIFNEDQFHHENNIALSIKKVLKTFYIGKIKRDIRKKLGVFYNALKAKAGNINKLDEKQKVLKVAYEAFYKAYNPKGADRLGVVYTPNAIVDFMIETTDHLCRKHFGKSIADKNVDILDPATGTGTFITSLLDFIPKHKLKEKYKTEIHCNEVAVLPYYIANLNIEYTYQMLMNEYEAFENIILTDTLDNAQALKYVGKQTDFFGMSEENTLRIKRQNERKISVIIGNPPYNDNQQNYNDFNANRSYPSLDKRIKDTFVKYSNAQRTRAYGMSPRFFRWAMDRVHNDGIIAFVVNDAFVKAEALDGFRKCVKDDFNAIYVVDLGGAIREKYGKKNSKISNVFDIQTGVAMIFLIKKQHKTACTIKYFKVNDVFSKDEKLSWLYDFKDKFDEIAFDYVFPTAEHQWINIAKNDFDSLLPVASKKEKKVLFRQYANAIKTNRDEWVYDLDEKTLKQKSKFLSKIYNQSVRNQALDMAIKWSRDLRNELERKKKSKFLRKNMIESVYRPFSKRFYYAEKIFNDVLTQNHYDFFGADLNKENLCIWLKSGSEWPFFALATNIVHDHLPQGGSKTLPLYTYDVNGKRLENVTDWGLTQFTKHYKDTNITKLDIFYYTYGVLHYPQYREKYELNLKREFPRLPFYKDFQKWASWGRALMSLHIEYETAEPYAFQQIDKELKKGTLIVPKLKAKKEEGIIILDSKTELHGVPSQAWTYKLGNRSALEWILDQYKEKKIRDATIREQFNTYRFADYKEQVIDLLKRVCTVSVETMKIVEKMKEK
ncbi:MAG: type ISP restriction/modification enzyme [Chitinophagales bacterium]